MWMGVYLISSIRCIIKFAFSWDLYQLLFVVNFVIFDGGLIGFRHASVMIWGRQSLRSCHSGKVELINKRYSVVVSSRSTPSMSIRTAAFVDWRLRGNFSRFRYYAEQERSYKLTTTSINVISHPIECRKLLKSRTGIISNLMDNWNCMYNMCKISISI